MPAATVPVAMFSSSAFLPMDFPCQRPKRKPTSQARDRPTKSTIARIRSPALARASKLCPMWPLPYPIGGPWRCSWTMKGAG